MSTAYDPSGLGRFQSATKHQPWKILVVENDQKNQDLSLCALDQIDFFGRTVEPIMTHSTSEARQWLKQEPNIAIALINLTLEHERSGLELVEYIRHELGNAHMRLIIRTTLTDHIPEHELIDRYDIDGCVHKGVRSRHHLYTTIRTALKSYRDIMTLEINCENLEKTLTATPTLYLADKDCFQKYSKDILIQIATFCLLPDEPPETAADGFILSFHRAGGQLWAGLGKFSNPTTDLPSNSNASKLIRHCTRIIRERREPLAGEVPEHALLMPLGEENSPPVGLIYLEHTAHLTDHDHQLIRILLHRLTSALENLRLHEEIKQANHESLYMLAQAADYKDQNTGEHIHRMSKQVRLLAMEMGIPEEQAVEMGEVSILHDIGKLGLPDSILQKNGPLTDHERELMQQHPLIGANILHKHPGFKQAAEIALNHHERWDGKGYPYGLSGTQIPLAARIVAVVDVFDALRHERPYKRAWPLSECLDALRSDAGHQFDSEAVDAFLRLYQKEGDSFLSPEQQTIPAAL